MNIRPTQSSNYDLVRSGIALNLSKLVQAQEHVSSGKRILRPSDDPVGAAVALSLKRQLADIDRYKQSINSSKPLVDAGLSAIDEASSIFSQAHALLIQGLNGTLSAQDRLAVGKQIEELKARLLEIGNTQFSDRFLFAGTSNGAAPFVENPGPPPKVVYVGSENAVLVPVGPDQKLAIGLAGTEVFGKFAPDGVMFDGLTGVAAGASANQGSGYATVQIRHDATSATLGAGLNLVSNGAQDTLLGDHVLNVDSVAGTVQLDGGTPVAIPSSTAAASDVTLTGEHGAQIHIDFSAYTGADFSGTVSGSGSISLDGTNFVALDFADTDLELADSSTGTILHVDTTGIARAGDELVTFSGTVNAFDVLQGIIDDLGNVAGLSQSELTERLTSRLSDLDHDFDTLQSAQATLGGTSQRLGESENRLQELDLSLHGLISNVEDVDLSSAILDMTKAEQTLQLAQATGARLLQNTLLNYLR